MKERISTIAPRVMMALFLAVALSLPNYAKAFQADRIQDDNLHRLYETYLADMGAQEAHAVLPALAIPASLAAAGVTTEMFVAASATIVTAIAGVSMIQVWDDLAPSDKQKYGSLQGWLEDVFNKANYVNGFTDSYGNSGDDGGGDSGGDNKGPKFTDKGKVLEAALLALCVGSGAVAIKDLAGIAGSLIDFVAGPAGEDEDGLPTGLGAVSNDVRIMATDDAGEAVSVPSMSLSAFEALCGYTLPTKDGYVPVVLNYSEYKGNLYVSAIYVNVDAAVVIDGFFDSPADPSSTWNYNLLSATDEPFTRVTMTYRSEKSDPVSWSGYYTASGYSAGLSKTRAYFCSDAPFTAKTSLVDLLYKAANAPDAVSGMLEDVVRAGAGTEAAQQIINNYVTNNIANSEKVVTVPSDLADTGDYDKVVTDPTPGPDPGPDPDPGGDETTAQKAEKFMKLPVQQLFPFCLVYDIQLLVEHVAGSGPATLADDSLVFEFDMGFGYFDAPLVIDLTGYRDMQGAFHMAFDVMLVVGLLYFSISLFLKARSD